MHRSPEHEDDLVQVATLHRCYNTFGPCTPELYQAKPKPKAAAAQRAQSADAQRAQSPKPQAKTQPKAGI